MKNLVNRQTVVLLGVLLTLGSFFGPLAELSAQSRLSREEGAIYLEEILDKPVRLKVLRPTNVYLQLDGKRNIGVLVPDREVELLALSEKAFRVRGKAKHAQVAGWVRPADLEGMTESLKENLEKLYQRAVLVEDLISKQQIALGMTMNEVERSMGVPTNTSSELDKDGRKDTYEYVTYKKVPQYGPTVVGPGGAAYSSMTYVKVPVGRVTISFENEQVTSIKEEEGDAVGGSPIRIVPAPIVLY